jgi:hypothetical protein
MPVTSATNSGHFVAKFRYLVDFELDPRLAWLLLYSLEITDG